MTTVTLGFAYGDDTVGKRGDDSFSEPAEHRRYQLGLSQILTADWVVGLNLEAVVDDGYLNNPYRSVRYLDSSAAKGYSYQPELYPGSRNGGAIGVISSYYLPWRAALDGYYRYYGDSWDIRAHSLEFEYRHALGDRWILSGRANLYRQDQAEFYSDLFAYADAQNYLARDKELASFSSWTLGLGARYSPPWPTDWPGVRPELLLEWDFMNFDYDNFRDLRGDAPVGQEPLYSVTASDIMVQGRAVTSLADFSAGDVLINEPLLAELRHQAGRRPPLAEAERQQGRPVTIMGDAALPYAVLKRLMATCGASEYRHIQLAVMKAATPMSGAATMPMAGADAPAAGGAHGG